MTSLSIGIVVGFIVVVGGYWGIEKAYVGKTREQRVLFSAGVGALALAGIIVYCIPFIWDYLNVAYEKTAIPFPLLIVSVFLVIWILVSWAVLFFAGYLKGEWNFEGKEEIIEVQTDEFKMYVLIGCLGGFFILFSSVGGVYAFILFVVAGILFSLVMGIVGSIYVLKRGY